MPVSLYFLGSFLAHLRDYQCRLGLAVSKWWREAGGSPTMWLAERSAALVVIIIGREILFGSNGGLVAALKLGSAQLWLPG